MARPPLNRFARHMKPAITAMLVDVTSDGLDHVPIPVRRARTPAQQLGHPDVHLSAKSVNEGETCAT